MDGNYICPFCQSGIALNDVNVASDIALCRNCGKTIAFSAIAGVSKVDFDHLDEPPKGLKPGRDINGRTTLTFHRISPGVFFLIPFTAVWGGFSLGGIYGSQILKGEFNLTMSLFGLPFLLGTLGMLAAIAFMLFGKYVVTLDSGEGTAYAGVGRIGRTKKFTYNRGSMVSLKATNYSKNGTPQHSICVRTDGGEVTFGAGINDEAKNYIIAILMKEIAALR